MWRAVDASNRLVYPDFVETVVKIVPLYWVRALGGMLYLLGFDYRTFSYTYQGLDQKLTGVKPARIVSEILA